MATTMQSTIYYFCYGSNMLTRRMQINNKSATKFANAFLSNYKLTFSGNSQVWKGATANIVKDPNNLVRGVVYTLDKADVDNLDRQEFGYDPIEVNVQLDTDSSVVTCRTYVQKSDYQAGENSIPSKLYKQVIIRGAEEHQLPKAYIDEVIKAFPDNGIVDCGPIGFTL